MSSRDHKQDQEESVIKVGEKTNENGFPKTLQKKEKLRRL